MSKSILEKKGCRSCYLCGMLYGDDSEKRILHKHHIFMGKYRKIAEKEGLWVHLCLYHHEGDINGDAEAVHSPHKNNYSRMLQELAQKKWEESHSHDEWMDLMGENFIGRESNEQGGIPGRAWKEPWRDIPVYPDKRERGDL